jgi:hypothetical protein
MKCSIIIAIVLMIIHSDTHAQTYDFDQLNDGEEHSNVVEKIEGVSQAAQNKLEQHERTCQAEREARWRAAEEDARSPCSALEEMCLGQCSGLSDKAANWAATSDKNDCQYHCYEAKSKCKSSNNSGGSSSCYDRCYSLEEMCLGQCSGLSDRPDNWLDTSDKSDCQSHCYEAKSNCKSSCR